jgi:putative Mg2+ transporter-C (MgtC) family protein
MAELISQIEWNLLFRLLFAAVCGGAIGYERDHRNKDAGMKTHMILAMGAALAMMISKYGFKDAEMFDAARVVAQVISGIGFLGAGVIFVKNNLVSGLTTAAGLWTTSIIGIAIGAGMYMLAVVSTLIIVILQLLLHQQRFAEAIKKYKMYLTVSIHRIQVIEDILSYFDKEDNISYHIVGITKVPEGYKVILEFVTDTKTDTVDFARYLSHLDQVDEFHF